MKNPKELFSEIVKLASDALASTESSNADIAEEKVVLNEDSAEKEVVSEVLAEVDVNAPEVEAPMPATAPVAVPTAVSKVEFDSAIAEIREMYTKVLESISPSSPLEVPAALTEEVKEELSEEVVGLEVEEKVLDTLKHDPEAEVVKKKKYLYATNRVRTTEDYVFNTLFNK
jgi:hypothetical protein